MFCCLFPEISHVQDDKSGESFRNDQKNTGATSLFNLVSRYCTHKVPLCRRQDHQKVSEALSVVVAGPDSVQQGARLLLQRTSAYTGDRLDSFNAEL